MSRKSAQRFCDNDMPKDRNVKRNKRILEIATRFGAPRFQVEPQEAEKMFWNFSAAAIFARLIRRAAL
ncbi:hypothetical protein BC360_19460 [Ensifer sp. LC163]|nr:hypothetical protein BC360_19460 [Ensifer sp. LC163]